VSGGPVVQKAYGENVYYRQSSSETAWGPWRTLVTQDNENRVSIPAGGILASPGRLHLHTVTDRMYLLPKDGVWITKDWGSNGKLNVTGGIVASKDDTYDSSAVQIGNTNDAKDTNIYSLSFGQAQGGTGMGLVPNSKKQWSDTTGPVLGTHIKATNEWGVFSDGWNPLFAIQGGTGNVKAKGEVEAQNLKATNAVYTNVICDRGNTNCTLYNNFVRTQNGKLLTPPGANLCNSDGSICVDVADIKNVIDNAVRRDRNINIHLNKDNVRLKGAAGWTTGTTDRDEGEWSTWQIKF
jgi:hypothetical protein